MLGRHSSFPTAVCAGSGLAVMQARLWLSWSHCCHPSSSRTWCLSGSKECGSFHPLRCLCTVSWQGEAALLVPCEAVAPTSDFPDENSIDSGPVGEESP